MFERFTERARQVVVLAQDEAKAMKHSYIGTEHLLLGLIREEEGLAARALESLDITVEEVRAQVARIVGDGEHESAALDQLALTPRSKKVLELSLREALSLGHNYIGTEHILLGLVRENEGVAARILLDFDADADKIRNEIIRMLSGPGRRAAKSERTLDEQIIEANVRKEVALEKQDFVEAASWRSTERKLRDQKQERQPSLESVWVYKATLNGSVFYFLPDGSRLVAA